jgi:peptide/nickel transport system ATP-binding protein
MISCKNLKIFHDQNEVVDISFEIRSSLALVGQSGSGKSLTLKALIGMLPKDFYSQIDIEAPFELKTGSSLSFIPQNPFTALSPMTKISKQWFGDENRAKELFDIVGLDWSLFFRYPPQLSGGELQRVIFAIALSQNPKLILLDEPTTALDPDLREEIADVLLHLQKEFGFLMLFVSHDITLASKICEDMVVIKSGKVIESGRSLQLLKSPQTSYTKSLIESNFANREFRE